MKHTDQLQAISEKLSIKIAEHIDAHLFESIVSLFNRGILKHYVRTPRTKLDALNFNMSIDAASGVRFEGRETIVELEQKLAKTQKALEVAKEAVGFYADRENYNYDGQLESDLSGDDMRMWGGQIARQAQQKINEIMQGVEG